MKRMLAMLLLATLAGCTSPDTTETGAEDAPDAGVITDPTDYNASAEGSHIHDYWGGQERVTVVDATDGCLNCTVFYGGDQGALVGGFRPEPDHVVPMGAAWIHATATWTIGSGDHKDVALYVKTANMTEAAFVGVLAQGETLTFNSTNDDNDPPHHRLSLWEFEVRARSSDGDGTEIANFEVTLRVEAERGLEIPVFPPHPDHWGGTTEILLHEQERDVQYHLMAPVGFGACVGCLGLHEPEDGKIIPPSASEVEVVIEIQDGLPGIFDLMMHGADTWDYARVSPDETNTDMTRLVWHLPVEGRPDSPYAKQSLWSLYVVTQQPEDGDVWKGTYTITMKALK